MTIAAALELSVLFVCIWGFIAILLTGQFGMPVVLLCIGALVVGYYVRRNGWKPSQLAANIAAIFVLLMAVSIFATTFNLLSATVHLFLFLQVTKYVTRRRLGEIRWCYLISLFNIIGASVITTTFTFGPVLLIYIFLVLVSLRLYVIAREFERNSLVSAQAALGGRASAAPGPNRPGWLSAAGAALIALFSRPRAPKAHTSTQLSLSQMRLPRGMISSGFALTLITMGLSGALFSIIPRLATQNLFQSYGQPKEESSVSAFSENVEFGSFTEIQLDDTIALFVEPEDSERPRYVRMRGVALDNFDGKSWRRSGGSFTQTGEYIYQPVFTTRLYPKTYKFRVLQPAGMTTFLFGDAFPMKLTVPNPYQFQVDRMAQSVWLSEAPPKEFQYKVECMQEDLLLRRDPTTLKLERPAMQLIPRVEQQRTEQAEEESIEAVTRFLGSTDRSTSSQAIDDDETSPRERRRYRETWRSPLWDDSDDLMTYAREDMTTNSRDELTTASYDSELSSDTRTTDRFRDRGWPHYYNRRRYRARTGPELLQHYLQQCLELPENLRTGRVPDLAAQWTQNSATTFTKAMAIETRLRTAYKYSLTPKATGNYIESFLFDVKEGHCEYFATSMAVLLRNIGIPSRVVNGFYSTEWNALSGNFTVRQKDAHSWVEAWMGDNYGWMTFDPTPPSGVARRNDRGAILETLSRMSDAIRMRWYRYVIDYSFSDQVDIIRYLSRVRERLLHAIKQVYIPGVTSKEATTIEQEGLYGKIDWRPIAASLGIVLLLLGWQATRWIMRRRKPQFSMVRFYDDLLKALAKRGITIRPGETPREFAARVAGMRPDWQAFASATDAYYSAKYDQHQLRENQVHEFAQLKKAIRQKTNRA